MRVVPVLFARLLRLGACTAAFCLLVDEARGQVDVLEPPTGVAVCQTAYGNPGTLQVSWSNPEMYEFAMLFVDGELAALADGADNVGTVQAPPGNHLFGVRGVVAAGASGITSVEFQVLQQSPVPEPITDLDCEFLPTMGGLLRVRWELGNDPWVSGRLEFAEAGAGVDIEGGATGIEVLTPSRLGGNEVVLYFKNEEGYFSPPFVTDCERRVPGFLRADCDASGRVNITDPIFHINHLFRQGPRGPCDDACDSNNDGGLNVTDAIYTLNYLFAGGSPPPAPGPMECGIDDDQDFLGGVCRCPDTSR